MSDSLKSIVNNHRYPSWLVKNPNLIHIHYFILKILYTRSRVVSKELNNIMESNPSNGTILDIGCGEGQYLIPLALKHRSRQFIGLDKNQYHIHFLNQYILRNKLSNLKSYLQDIDKANLTLDSPIHCLYMVGLLQYLDHPESIFRTIHSLQHKGGKLLIYSPIKHQLDSRWYGYLKSRLIHYDMSQQNYQPLEEDNILHYLEKNNYRILQKKYYYSRLGQWGHEILQSLVMIFTNCNIFTKIFALLIGVFLSPIFVTLQVVDSYLPNKSGNSILLIAEKK